jgi:biotin synthase-like enzyme
MEDEIKKICSTHCGNKCMKYCGQYTSGKIQIWKQRYRWEDNIKMDAKQLMYEGKSWIQLVYVRPF